VDQWEGLPRVLRAACERYGVSRVRGYSWRSPPDSDVLPMTEFERESVFYSEGMKESLHLGRQKLGQGRVRIAYRLLAHSI